MSERNAEVERPIVELAGVAVAGQRGSQALDKLDLSVRRGEVFAALGSHGAGKTTLLDVVAGLVRPHAGTVQLRLTSRDRQTQAPVDRRRNADRRARLVYAGRNGLHESLTPPENVRFFLALAGSSTRLAPLEVENTLRSVGVRDEHFGRRLGLLPRAVPTLVHLALALLRGAPLVLLDDPSLGLDSAETHALRESIQHLRNHGITVLLATSDVMLAGAVADRIGVFASGRIAFVREGTGWFGRSALELYTDYLGEPEPRATTVGPLLGEDRAPA